MLPPISPRLSIAFLLTERFTLCAFANFVDVLRLAADEGDRSRPIRCRWRVLSATMAPVRSSCGVAVQPDARLGDPAAYDYVVVVGGLIGEDEGLDRESVAFLRRAAAAGVALVGVCTGAFVLHRAGLMQGYRCCVSWFHRDDFLDAFEGLEPVSDEIFVVDRDRLTCSGGVSSAHLAAHLVARHVDRAAAKKSLNIMIIEEAMAGERPQPGLPLELSTRDPLVRRALGMIHESLETPPTVARLAARLGVGRRKLERHFAEALGLSPQKAARLIRLARVKQRLATSDRSVTEIAAETGFCDVSHLVRAFRAAEGMTPDAWRRGNDTRAPTARGNDDGAPTARGNDDDAPTGRGNDAGAPAERSAA
ncbi:GlxA family transcriptional regulator [Acuticoccus mangrovi]|uniref:GlxA family transcriptional regulator n=1 Tax=Acuticoccus mangrovi TaxID=2796142 RepID=A0A934IN79_9HYPH|nr:GlxA family transcriptional regulator [Acuticoccus mangrovi]MBJ3775478.1 GlxA family transcriptional regulator [Acuticoccus mangrovi]